MNVKFLLVYRSNPYFTWMKWAGLFGFILILTACESTPTKMEDSAANAPQTPILFLGVFDGGKTNSDISRYLSKSSGKNIDGWGTSSIASDFFNDNPSYKNSMRIKSYKEYLNVEQRELDDSLRMGFFTVNSHHYFREYSKGVKVVWTTMKLSWVELGSASRKGHREERVFEVLNSRSVITTAKSDITHQNQQEVMSELYQKQFHGTLKKLVTMVISQQFEGRGEAVYFMMDQFKLGSKARNLVSQYLKDVNKDGKIIDENGFALALEIALRNHLGEHLRSRSSSDLADIIILPSKKENDMLRRDWMHYIERYKNLMYGRDNLAEDRGVFTQVAPLASTFECTGKESSRYEKRVPGYLVQAVLNKFFKMKTLDDDQDKAFQVRAINVGQIVFPMTDTHSLAAPDSKISKKEQRVVGLYYQPYLHPKHIDFQADERLNIFEDTLDKSINDMAKKLAELVIQTARHNQRDMNNLRLLCP